MRALASPTPQAVNKTEIRCAGCGYGGVVSHTPDRCPMCGGTAWHRPPRRSDRDFASGTV